MQFVRIDFWPAGLVIASAVLIAMALRSLERFAHDATARRTRLALQRTLGGSKTGGGATEDTGVG